MKIKNLTVDKILIFAILFSVIWHLFWLSTLTVVVVPKDTKPLKFSGVSFLGPILEGSMLNVRVDVRERSALEKRYLSDIENLSVLIKDMADSDAYINPGISVEIDPESEEMITSLAILAIDGNKLEL